MAVIYSLHNIVIKINSLPTDYVRTFTLDKRLEMYLKKTAGRGLPTVVYPELYRKRFCDAMERYFTVVPDKWTGLETDVNPR